MVTKRSKASLKKRSTKRKPTGKTAARKSARKTGFPFQSSPITIGGGGSVGIDVSLPPVQQGAFTVFSKAGDTLHRLFLIDKHGALQNITPPPNSQVEVLCKRRGKDSIITIYSDPYGLKFETAEFLRVRPSGSTKEVFFNGDHKIDSILVRPSTGPADPPIPPPTAKNCTLIILNTN